MIKPSPLRFFLCLSSLTVVFMGAFNFISHSELWSITQSDIFMTANDSAISTYYRPLFYAILKLFHFIPMDNITHIQVARIVFSIFAFASFCIVIFNVKLITQSDLKAAIFGLFLFSLQIYFYNIFRVRSDMLATFFILLAYTQVNLQYFSATKNQWRQWPLPLLCFLSFLCTPKAIYLIFALFAYKLFLSTNENRRLLIWKFLKGFVLPLGLLFLTLGQLLRNKWIEHDPYTMALTYYLRSFTSNDKGPWLHLTTSLEINPGHYLLILCGLAVFFLNSKMRHNRLMQAQVLLFSLSSIALIIHPEKWSYFIAPLIPFLSLPFVFVLYLTKNKTRLAAILSIFLVPTFILNHPNSWFRSNQNQLQAISTVEKIYKQIPEATYFDSTGLLPREKNNMQFLGPNDQEARFTALKILSEKQPEFIFFTSKLNLAKPEIIIFLKNHYFETGTDVWTRQDLMTSRDSKKFSSNHNLQQLFIFDYLPVGRFQWLDFD